MKLFPQDLGQKRGLALQLRRAGLSAEPTAPEFLTGSGEEAARIGTWGRLWLKKPQSVKASRANEKGVADDETLSALRSLRPRLQAWTALGTLPALGAIGFFIGGVNGEIPPPEMLAFFIGSSALAYFCAVGRPRALLTRRLRQMSEQPLTAAEIASLFPSAGDDLERSYLTLMMDVSRQEIAALPGTEAGARSDLREALQALGDAIDRLPVGRSAGTERPDILTEVLRRTAEETLKTAQAEPDRVVAASLVRQVEALHRRADATARADTLVRRFGALRQEIAAETEALRAGLSAYYTGSGDVTDLTRLVQSVRAVAREAAAVTAAVEEVDGFLEETGKPVIASPTSVWTPRRPVVATEALDSATLRLGQRQ